MDTISASIRPGHAALRRGRRSLPGQSHLITATTADRKPWLRLWPLAVAVAREVGGPRLWRDNHVHAWVLMPDHIHVLLTLGGTESLSHLMNRVKAASSRAAHMLTGSRAPFWDDAFHDHALRRNEETAIAARYVIGNPVRASLTETIWTWPFWDCEWLPHPDTETTGEAPPFTHPRQRCCTARALP